MLVIGTKDYLEHMLVAFLPMKFIKAYPNPFSSRILIRYRIPLGIKEICFTLYNLRGQRLWRGIERKNLTPGEHVYSFDGRAGLTGRFLPAGLYIMRMTAKNSAGKNVYGGKKRLICIK